MPTPLAVFTYNRPRHARQLFQSLLNCARLEECAVYTFCDGARECEHAASVLASRQVVREFAARLNNARVIEREKNMGVDHSIVEGVSELCTQYGRVIVLEDDLILHPAFLDFMLQSLDRYSEDERVAQIAGFTFPIEMPHTPDSFFLPLTNSWGWATWKRAWDLFCWDTGPALAELGANSHLCARFDLDGAYPYYEMLRSTERDKTDIWDIRWYWQTFSADKLTLYPRQSLVWQNGFSEDATHTKVAWPAGMQAPLDLFLKEQRDHLISFPLAVQADQSALQSLKRFLRRQPSHSLLSRLGRTLKRLLTWHHIRLPDHSHETQSS